MRWILIVLLSLVLTVLAPATAAGQAGVGVNVGSIQVDEPLAPGGTYQIPSVGVINTGHDPADYSLRIIYLHEQEELEPPEEWFTFHPDRFRLEPGTAQNVGISLRLPLTARPGDYFTFVEAYPLPAEESAEGGGVVIGIAAASKLNFTVEPSNVFSAAFLWTFHRFRDLSPFSYVGAGTLGTILLLLILLRFAPLRIRVERR